ncbi:MAG: TraR/DksA family transcriptional regulator [Deltaproteobacteria bacterium]|nr:TraR/DksA family transcriptional regulator [Candidatus Zymogenaceae bacterium]
MPEEIKELLVKMRRELIGEIKEKTRSESEADRKDDVGDIYDLATNERDRELNLLMSDREREKLNEINDALVKIDEGTYGICEECGTDIPKKRLIIMPFARLCVNCKSEMEKTESVERDFKQEREYRKLAFTATEDEEN